MLSQELYRSRYCLKIDHVNEELGYKIVEQVEPFGELLKPVHTEQLRKRMRYFPLIFNVTRCE